MYLVLGEPIWDRNQKYSKIGEIPNGVLGEPIWDRNQDIAPTGKYPIFCFR